MEDVVRTASACRHPDVVSKPPLERERVPWIGRSQSARGCGRRLCIGSPGAVDQSPTERERVPVKGGGRG